MRPLGLALRIGGLHNVCHRCSRQISRELRRELSLTRPRTTSASIAGNPSFKNGYFLSNNLLHSNKNSSALRASTEATSSSAVRPGSTQSPPFSPIDNPATQDLPHRRRQAAKQDATTTNDTVGLPANSSTVLAELAAQQRPDSLRRTLSAFLSLSKPRLTVLIVLTAMAPYALYPTPEFAHAAPSLSPLTLAFLTGGTALCSAAANTLNMLYEPATDALMSRTRARPLVRGLVSRRAAAAFAVVTGAVGVAALAAGVNPTVAALGAANIVLYAGVYTPLKRVSAVNTWVGAVVGAIPPLMGWAAAAGECATGAGGFRELLLMDDSAGGWLLAALLFAWQFPHFMALSWGVRDEYRAAGLRMLVCTNPARNARVALRYSIVFFPICVALSAAGVTEWSFAVTSAPVNAWLTWEAIRFWRYEGAKGSARGLFWASVWHLPVVMVLALLQKKGMWSKVWKSVMGEPDFDEDEWEYVDEQNSAEA
jgi:heme o synthase